MMEFITSHIMELGWTLLLGILGLIYRQSKNNFSKIINDNKNVKYGVQAVLHDRILQKCTFILKRGYATTDDLEEIQTLNDPYVALGGNGTVKIAIKKVKELPLK